MTEETPNKKPRKKRRTKAQIEAEKKAKAAVVAEAEKMESEGFEKVRHRDDKGHYVKDDPSTPENEAWDWVKKDENEELEKAIELNFGSSYEKEVDELLELDCGVHIEKVKEPTPTPLPKLSAYQQAKLDASKRSTPATYANPNGEYIANRYKRNRAVRKDSL